MDQPIEESIVEAGQPNEELDLDNIADGMDEGDEGLEIGQEAEIDDDATQSTQDDDDSWKTRKAKVQIDGQEMEITVDEALKGYMRDADYRRKTTEAAAQLTQAQALRQQVEQEREQRVNQLDVLVEALHRELIGDQQRLAQLIETDPQEYLRQQALMQNKTALLSQAVQQRMAIQQQAINEQAKQRAESLAKADQALSVAIPEWKDPAKRQAMQQDIRKVLMDVGYTPNEFADLSDHRALLIAHKAALWDKSQSLAAKKAKEAGNPGKAVRPGTANKSNNAQAANAAERLRRNPESLDALAAFGAARGI